MAIKLTTFRRIRNLITTSTARTIYKATILPLLDYNDIVYSLLNENLKKKLQTIQNRALRTIYIHKNYSVDELHEKAKLDRLTKRRDVHLLGLMYRRKELEKYVDERNLPTRQHQGVVLRQPVPKSNCLLKAPIYRGSKMWNELPAATRNAMTYETFKNRIKQHQP